MKTDLEKLLEFCQDLKKGYDNPASYCEAEYYVVCKAKSYVLDDVIGEINSLKENN